MLNLLAEISENSVASVLIRYYDLSGVNAHYALVFHLLFEIPLISILSPRGEGTLPPLMGGIKGG